MSWANTCFVELTQVEIDDEGNYIINPVMINVRQIEYIKPSDDTDPNIGCYINTRDSWIDIKQSYKEVCDILADQELVFWFGHKEENNEQQ